MLVFLLIIDYCIAEKFGEENCDKTEFLLWFVETLFITAESVHSPIYKSELTKLSCYKLF